METADPLWQPLMGAAERRRRYIIILGHVFSFGIFYLFSVSFFAVVYHGKMEMCEMWTNKL